VLWWSRRSHPGARRVLHSGSPVWLATIAVGCAAVTHSPERQAPSQAELQRVADSIFQSPTFRSAVCAMLAVNSQTGDTVYSRLADKVLVPASNMKIATGAVALAQLGPDFRTRTVFGKTGTLSNRTLSGDLIVIGRGDPSFSDRMRGSVQMALDSIADSIAAQGIREVTGRLISAGNAFPGPQWGYGWAWEDLREAYGAGVDELLYNDGRADPTDTSFTRSPALGFLVAFDSALRRRGIRVTGGPAERADVPPFDTIVTVASPALREVLGSTLKTSQNQIAEMLLRSLALERTGVGVADSGAAVVTRQLLSWGAPPEQLRVHDGSGLSRSNMMSAKVLVTTLIAVMRDTAFSAFYDALSVAGVDGTLANRLKKTPAEGNVRGKTGTVEGVRSVSGYARNSGGATIVFGIICNGATSPGLAINAGLDTIIARLPSTVPAR
jgi:serine-type D-Ala-D-Ala carboxypeptidase/endopeptidase (penicillin-binding protein 4)